MLSSKLPFSSFLPFSIENENRVNEDGALKLVLEKKDPGIPLKAPSLEEDENESGHKELPPEIASLIAHQLLDESKIEENLKIWPVIWDFAGQDIYRAIHPIFMSPKDIYLLVLDITKELSERADCRVNEYLAPSRDSEDTNWDHILRWLDLIHSLKMSGEDKILPPVMVVGTHATSPDPNTDIALMQTKFKGTPKKIRSAHR